MLEALKCCINAVRSLIIWMKMNEYPTCDKCVYYDHEDARCNMLQRHMFETEYCSKWDERE